MNRAFVPYGGGVFRPPFRPFPHPFFPRRFLFPFFFFSPFFFPFFRDERDQNDMYFAQYQTKAGDTLEMIAHAYNIPVLILAEANPHIENPKEIQPGSTVHIPRISNMHCQMTYMEREVESQPASNQQPVQSMRNPGANYHW